MKLQIPFAPRFIAIASGIAFLGLPGTTELKAANTTDQPKLFNSSDDAIRSLVEATGKQDKETLHQIFGPEFEQLLTGDKVQDATHFKTFTTAMSEKCVPVRESDDKLTLEIGKDQWPFPIPLVKQEGKWFFDTDAGKEEIINRHIGSDEFHAIGVCRAYVEAQRRYASLNPDGTGVKKYAVKLKSTPGKKDGLYWQTSGNETPAPFEDLVEKAHEEGYGNHKPGTGPHPYHGYFFRVLTSQGRAAHGGKKDYLVHGDLTGGFALVAYPVRWGQSGVMTFIINQDGKVYQRNLGEKTSEIASKMTQYNPTRGWAEAEESGVIDK